jgi:Flp pilus assembly CpaF family ATPase
MSALLQSFAMTSLDRRIRTLRPAMGPLIAAALEDPDVVEIMLNPDRTLWVDRRSSGRAPLRAELSEEDGERIIRLVAAHIGVAQGRRGQPSAVIRDGRTIQSTCESGPRAGYEGYKRKRGGKVHIAVDTWDSCWRYT